MNRRLILFVLLLLLSLPPLTASAQDNFTITFGGRVFTGTQTTFTYIVTGTGISPDLSHFDLEIPVCEPLLEVVAYSPTDAVSFGVDPTTGVDGIKWDLPLLVTETRVYTITFAGNVGQGTVNAAIKDGNGFTLIPVPGPACVTASVAIQKYVSVDGLTWQDANSAPGPQVPLDGEVSFRFVVTNNGITPLTGIVLADSVFDTSACAIPETLAPEAFFECVIGPLPVEAGQHGNTASVTASFEDITVTATDDAFYFGGDVPEIDIEKYAAINGGDWQDADTPILLESGDDEATFEASFRFVISNPGTVPLENLTLTDNVFDTSTCSLPASLAPAESFECVIGPFPADDDHTNIATATGDANGLTVSDSDSASYTVEDDDVEQPVIIIIEGPVTAINVNIITIYDIDIEINVDNPLLTVIQIGDVIRVEGEYASGGPTIVIIAINIIIINVDVVIIDGGENPIVWRDDGSCANPPPPWAPANGWRRRCGGGGNESGRGFGYNDDSGGRGGGDRDDNDDRDDDDDDDRGRGDRDDDD